MQITEAINRVVDRESLSSEQTQAVMRAIMTGEASPAQIAGFLIAMRMKGETVDELAAAASVMRSLSTKVAIKAANAVDTCGTGGDGASIFNVSTASAFVAAAAGVTVAKHGNRSISSSSGSADLLEAAGVRLDLNAEQVARCIDELGIGFMFAVNHHSAMKHAIGPRRELKTRTLFNVLGPLTNPAGVKRQVLGVYDQALCKHLAEVLAALGSEHVLVVCSDDGLDEFSIAAGTHYAELQKGEVREGRFELAEHNISPTNLKLLKVADAEASLSLIKEVFNARLDTQSERVQAASDMISVNAGPAIYVAGDAADLKQGIEMARDAIASGAAAEKLQRFAEFTQLL